MPLFALIVVVQIALIVHVVRTGRPTYWVIVLLIAPGIGGLAYFIVELLPELSSNRHARSAMRGVKKTLNPEGDLRQKQRQLKLSGSVDAARHLAGELVEGGRYTEAIEHYQTALTGLYEHDPDLMLGLAKAYFGNKQYAETKQTLDSLIKENPNFKSPEGHLLFARAVEEIGDYDTALDEYKAVAAYYAGAEARARYGLLLEKQGDLAAARAEFEEIITAAELAPRHYRSAQRQWINEAKSGIKRLSD